jgi:hypothetical protein
MKKFLSILAIAATLNFFTATHVFAASWVVFENFDTLVDGAGLVGTGDGTGWSGNWLDHSSGTNWQSVTAPAGGQGCLAAFTTTGASMIKRDFAASISASTVHFEFYLSDSTAANRYDVAFFTAADGARFGVEMNAGGAGGGALSVNATDFSSFVADTGFDYVLNAWNDIDVKFGHVAGKFAISVNGSAYSADFTSTGSNTTIQRAFIASLDASSNGDFYVDDLGDVAGATCSSGGSPDSGDYEWFWNLWI